MIIAYYFSINKWIERTNQIVEIVLHYLLIKIYKENWNALISKIEYFLNAFENVLTFIIFFESFYKIKVRNFLLKMISN